MPRGIAAKLNDEQRIATYKMYAENITPLEISKWIKENWSIEYQADSVSHLVKTERAQPFLKRFKEDYLNRVKEVPIANKRIRVDDLEIVRLRLMRLIKDNPLETKAQKEEFRFLVRSLNDTVTNAREEMEKKPFINLGLGDFSDKSDDQLIEERNELLKQAERLVSGPVIEISGTPEGTENPNQVEPS